MSVVLRTRSEPERVAASLRRIVTEVEADMPVSSVQSLDALIAQSLAQPRFTMGLLLSFAVLALVLALLGIYGVTAYAVAQRNREIAVRVALGAGPRHLLWLIVRQGLALAVLGVALGVPAALVATHYMGEPCSTGSAARTPQPSPQSPCSSPRWWRSPAICRRGVPCTSIRFWSCGPNSRSQEKPASSAMRTREARLSASIFSITLPRVLARPFSC